MRNAAVLSAVLLVAGCAVARRDAGHELLRATGAATVLLDENVSLYSPYGWVTTNQFFGPIQKQRREVFELLEVPSEGPTVVWLQIDPKLGVRASADGERMRIDSVSFETEDGVLGESRAGVVAIRVAPLDVVELADGRRITGTLGVETYADSIRHEMAHAAAFHLGLRESGWLGEGLAHVVEWIPWQDGALRLSPVPDELELAAGLPRTARSLDAVLAWEQRVPVTDEDRTARLLAFSLVAFLIERERAPSFREAVLRVAALDERRIRALESDWSSWLDRCLATSPARGSDDASDG